MDDFSYKSYEIIRDSAWKILIKQKAVTFPIDINSIVSNLNINLFTYDESEYLIDTLKIDIENEANAIFFNKQYYILYDPGIYPPRIRFNIAHELGHILLGHVENFNKKYTRNQEQQADMFAARILIPLIIIREEQLFTVDEVVHFFNVSKIAAHKRLQRYLDVAPRDKFLVSPLEKKYRAIYLKNKKKTGF